MPNTVVVTCVNMYMYVQWYLGTSLLGAQFVNYCLCWLLVRIVLVKSYNNFFGHLARTWTEDYVTYGALCSFFLWLVGVNV